MARARRFRSGKTLFTLSLATIAVLGLAIIAASTSVSARADAEVVSENPDTTNALSPVQIALSLGLTPDSAAAAGITGTDLELALGYCELHTDSAGECMDIDANLSSAQLFLNQLMNEARQGGVSDALAQFIDDTRADIGALTAERDAIRDELRSGLLVLLASQVGSRSVELFDNYSSNISRRVPREYRCLDLADHEWQALASALDKLKSNRAAQDDEHLDELSLSEDESRVLAYAQSSQDVQAARQRLDGQLDFACAVFEQAE